jgi:hypothetical protein
MKTWQPGETAILRGMYENKPWYIQSVRVVKDTPAEVALLLLPGAECAAPAGYIHQKHGDHIHWERWQEVLNGSWQLEKYLWRTNRFLILIEPKKYFSTILIWDHASNEFQCYYINFQLPFERSHSGFDTFDLELDLIIEPGMNWRWKDVEDYEKGIRLGVLRPEWILGIELAKQDVFGRIEHNAYPLNEHWLNWLPEPGWNPTDLPPGWEN